MCEMKFIYLFIIVPPMFVIVCDCFNLKEVLDEVYKIEKDYDNSKERVFLSKIWPEIANMFDQNKKPVKLPLFQENVDYDRYLSSTSSEVELEVNEKFKSLTFQSDLTCKLDAKRKCAVVEVDVTIKNPVKFEIFVKTLDFKSNKFTDTISSAREEQIESDSHSKETVELSFHGKNQIKFWLRIPDFSSPRKDIPEKCTVYIHWVKILNLSESKMIGESEIGKKFWKSIKDNDIHLMMQIGIMKTLLDLLPSDNRIIPIFQKNLFCLSNNFNIMKIFKKRMSWYKKLDNLLTFKNSQTTSGPGLIIKGGKIIYDKFNIGVYISYIQIGIKKSVNELQSETKKEVSSADFKPVEVHWNLEYKDYSLTTYAPVAFTHLREFFSYTEEDYVKNICDDNLIELSNPGSSVSGLYLSKNKYFIIKTIETVEANFQKHFFPAYFSHLHQNPDTLLSKFFGLYEYKLPQFTNSAIFLLVMENLLPSNVRFDQKYDLKGSTFQREASGKEKLKTSPTYKDNDFTRHHPKGIFLKKNDYKRLLNIIERDCRVLERHNVMDYSLLLGLHYEDKTLKKEESDQTTGDNIDGIPCETPNVQEEIEDDKKTYFAKNGIPAVTVKGDKILLYLGIIDILQTYRIYKKFENFWKHTYLHQKNYSVVRPKLYATRFKGFMKKKVFKLMPPCAPVHHTGV